jgi:quinone-modifying oxidoreductase subunit QmoC
MPETLLLQPDTAFIKDVIASGGGDLKKCFQCATCSVVCKLSPEDSPFPRKQMIEAQWGLKEKLLGDPALWLCHNCGDCTAQCPRGARPGDVLGALRREAIKHFAFPGFMGRLVGQASGLPLLFLLPALVFAAMAFLSRPWKPELEFGSVFPIPWLEALFFTVSGIVLLCFAIGLRRFMRASGTGFSGVIPALREIAAHQRFAECGAEKGRRLGHLLTFWAFLGLAFMGTSVGIGTMTGMLRTPLPLASPWKIFANTCAVVIVIGGVLLLVERIKRATSTYFDWFFLLTLVGVVFTGVLSELLRLAQVAALMYPVYFVHLVLIFSLFLYAPYSKFAHFLYRTVAMMR